MPSDQHPTPSQAISEPCPPTGRPDTKRWQTVSEGYRKNITHVHLLATVILVLNVDLLAIDSVTQTGIVLPWASSASVLSALTTIVVGAFMLSPRELSDNRWFSFAIVVCTMCMPFIFFTCSAVFFLVASLFWAFSMSETGGWMMIAGIGSLCAIISIYWMITEPLY